MSFSFRRGQRSWRTWVCRIPKANRGGAWCQIPHFLSRPSPTCRRRQAISTHLRTYGGQSSTHERSHWCKLTYLMIISWIWQFHSVWYFYFATLHLCIKYVIYYVYYVYYAFNILIDDELCSRISIHEFFCPHIFLVCIGLSCLHMDFFVWFMT